jgi:hypothetical protein
MGSFAIPGDLPGDQRLETFGSLEFDTPALGERTEILGNGRIYLDVVADRPDALVAVRLIDVAPGGAATLVTRGFLNLAHRESSDKPEALIPGERYTVRVQLVGVAYAFLPGHRIRLAISTAYWPVVWPSPNAVRLTVFTGASRVVLPVRQTQADDIEHRPLADAAMIAPPRTTVIRQGRVERTVSEDQVTGIITHRLYIDGGAFGGVGKVKIDEIDLEIAHAYERIYSIHPADPNSAVAKMTQCCEIGRGEWQIKILTSAEMTSTDTTFELDAWVEAYEGDELVRRKTWKSGIPRIRI